MRTAKIHSISESEHFVDYAEMPFIQRIEEEPDKPVPFAAFVSWLVIGAFCWVAILDGVRAVIRWPYWSWILR